MSATSPPRRPISAEAEVTKVDGHRIEFKVGARDETEEIGNGTREPMVVDIARIGQHLEAKTRGDAGRASKTRSVSYAVVEVF